MRTNEISNVKLPILLKRTSKISRKFVSVENCMLKCNKQR